MELKIDQEQQEHLYACLKAGRKEFGGLKKKLEALEQSTDDIDEQLEINKGLSRMLNPRGEEEARDEARRDPAQIDIEEEIGSSGETGGGHPTGELQALNEVGNPPTDEELRDLLLLVDCEVPAAIIATWTSSDRDAAQQWAWAVHLSANDNFDVEVPEQPEVVQQYSMGESEREQWLKHGPYLVLTVADDPESPDAAEVVHSETKEVDERFARRFNAECRAARLNKSLASPPAAEAPAEAEQPAAEAPATDEPTADGTSATLAEQPDLTAVEAPDTEDTDAWMDEPVRVDDAAIEAIKAAADQKHAKTSGARRRAAANQAIRAAAIDEDE